MAANPEQALTRKQLLVLSGSVLLALLLLMWMRGRELLGILGGDPTSSMFNRDFRDNYYFGALAFFHGFYDIYSTQPFVDFLNAQGYPVQPGSNMVPAVYPPLTYMIYVPLTLFPPLEAGVWQRHLNVLWLTLSVAILFLGQRWSWRERLLHIALALPLAFLSSPALDGLFAGQVSFAMLLLVTGFAVLYLRGESEAALLLLALSISIKLTPAVLGALLLRKRRWREIGMLAAFTLALQLPVLIYSGSPRLYADFLAHMPSVGAPLYDVYVNQSVPSLIYKFLGPTNYWTPWVDWPQLARTLSLVCMVAALGVTLLAIDPGSGPARTGLEIGALLLVHLLFLGRSWPHQHLYTVTCLALLYLAARRDWARYQGFFYLSFLFYVGLAVMDGETAWDPPAYMLRARWLQWHVGAICVLGMWVVNLAMQRHLAKNDPDG